MHDLIATTALGEAGPRADRFEGLSIAENPDFALVSVAARLDRQEGLSAAMKKAFGLALPDVGLSRAKGALSAFWTGPDQWMIEAPHDSHEDLAAQLGAALGENASVVEQNDGWVRFDIEGPRASDMFERLCPLDTRRMQPDAVSRTSIEHLGCFVLRRDAGEAFSVLGPRSSAGSLHHALCTAARSAL